VFSMRRRFLITAKPRFSRVSDVTRNTPQNYKRKVTVYYPPRKDYIEVVRDPTNFEVKQAYLKILQWNKWFQPDVLSKKSNSPVEENFENLERLLKSPHNNMGEEDSALCRRQPNKTVFSKSLSTNYPRETSPKPKKFVLEFTSLAKRPVVSNTRNFTLFSEQKTTCRKRKRVDGEQRNVKRRKLFRKEDFEKIDLYCHETIPGYFNGV